MIYQINFKTSRIRPVIFKKNIIRSIHENNSLVSGVSGEITMVNLSNNQHTTKGDTLIKIKAEKINEKIELNSQKMEDNYLFIADLQKLLYGNDKSFNNNQIWSVL